MGSESTNPTSNSKRSRRWGTVAITCFALGTALTLQGLGWAPNSYLALTKSLGDGTASIDRYHWTTGDKSWINGHFYSVKAPGMSVVLLPVYEGLKLVGFESLSRSAARASDANVKQKREEGLRLHGLSRSRLSEAELRARAPVKDSTLTVWALTLFGALIPAVAILLLLRSVAERWVPGTGAASAIALALGTLILPFAGLLFSHLIATLALFAAFVILIREREHRPDLRLVALAGLLAGLAVFFEYPLAFGGAVVGIFAVFAHRAADLAGRLRRALAYSAGVLVGALPVGIYNLLAFGSLTTLSYQNTVSVQGITGHDKIGLVDSGLFGIGVPSLQGYYSILLSPRGLIALTPIVVAAAIGVVLMYRQGRKPEALTIAGICLIFMTYVSGYIWPLGGSVPGPRYLIPILPFLGLGLPFAWKRLPSVTLTTGLISAVTMIAATIAKPLVNAHALELWTRDFTEDSFRITIFTAFGAGTSWWTIAPMILAFVAAVGFAAVATSGLEVSRDRIWGFVALIAWVLIAWLLAPQVTELREGATVAVVGLPPAVIQVAAGVALIGMLLAAQPWLWRQGRK